jgi:phage-related protein
MERAQILLTLMDKIQKFMQVINEYIEQGIGIFHKIKDWVVKIIGYIEQGIDRLVSAIGGRKEDLLLFHEDDLFV